MRIALYGNYLYELAVALRANTDNDVHLFLDSRTIPACLSEEIPLRDETFVHSEPWVTYREIICPRRAKLTKEFSAFDVILTTDLGPIFAARSGTKYVFIPGGSDLTQWPFPIHSRSTRPHGLRRDILELIIAARLRPAIRSSVSIWTSGPWSPNRLAAGRLGLTLDMFLLQMVDTDLFSPSAGVPRQTDSSESLTIFHPTRIAFESDPRVVEVGGYMGNDILFRGFAQALQRGINARLVLIDRKNSSDTEVAKELIEDLGISDHVEWLRAKTSEGFTWREMVDHYRACDIVASEFSGWTGLISVEAASCGKPVITWVEEDAMERLHPEGHPFVQAKDDEGVCAAISMLADADIRRSIGESSRSWVLAKHERGQVARTCESMLARLGFT
ncbi:MAG TPA: glycosyltransferase [Gemmatimonadetes bacterium]|nr:glycosyltransferase [Gemmatimonadota bacterium]